MSIPKHLQPRPSVQWDFTGLNETPVPGAQQISNTPRPHLHQDVHSKLASRNPSSVGTKRPANHDHIGVSVADPETPFKKIKLEDDSESMIKVPKYCGFVDLTGDSSDEDPARPSAVKGTTKTRIPQPSAAPSSKSGRTSHATYSTAEANMMGVIHTPAPSFLTTIPQNPSSLSGKIAADDNNPFIIERAKKQHTVTRVPFNLDDSDSNSDLEPEPATERPGNGTRRFSLSPKHQNKEAEKLIEEKAAQLKYAAELRGRAEAKKLAEKKTAELKHAADLRSKAVVERTARVQSNARRSKPTHRSDSVLSPSHTKAESVQKPAGASKFATGRKLEPGRVPSTSANISSTSTENYPHGQQIRAPPTHVALPAMMSDHSAVAPSATMKHTRLVGAPSKSEDQHVSPLQKAFTNKTGGSTTAHPRLNTLPLKQNGPKKVSFDLSQDTTSAPQPSMSADQAGSKIEKLKRSSLSYSATPRNNGSGGRSQAQKAEFSGEDLIEAGEEANVSASKPRSVVNLAASEDSTAHSLTQDDLCKAALARELTKAEIEAARANEQRRRIESRRLEKEMAAEKAKADEQQAFAERSRLLTRAREEREAEEIRRIEDRRLTSAKLQAGIQENKKAEDELQRKKLEARKEQQKQQRIKKMNDINARKHIDAAAEVQANAALQEYEDSGELVLEGEPTHGRNLQASRDAMSVRIGQGSATSTGPVALNSEAGTLSVQRNFARTTNIEPMTTQQRIMQEAQKWEYAKNESSDVVKTSSRQSEGDVSSAFASGSGRNFQRAQGSSSTTPGSPAPRKTRSNDRALGRIQREDAKLIQWRDQENMDWSRIAAEWLKMTGSIRAEATLTKRCSKVRSVLRKAQVGHTLLQKLAAGDEHASEQVNAMVEASEAAAARRDDTTDLAPLGRGPIRLPVQPQHTNGSPLWKPPAYEFEESRAIPSVVKPRSAPETLASPEVRPTTGGKCLKSFYEIMIGRNLEAGNKESNVEDEDVSYPEEEEDTDPYQGFEAEDYQNYGFQVQRRELTTEDAQMGFPIENQEWFSCGQIFRNYGEAKAAATAELLTIMPGGAFYGDPGHAPVFQYAYVDSNRLERLMFCTLVNPVHGTVQTTVEKIILAPSARMPPPTREEFQEELKARELWYIHQQITIEPPLPADFDPLFEAAPEPITEIEGDKIAYTDYDLATKRAAQIFVDATYKSELQSLNSRSQEKRDKVEGYLAGILADKTFSAEMEIVEKMEGNAAIRNKYMVKLGSKVTLGVWLESGELRGPLN
ncbi:uncharacterized protein RCC_10597 [Ramularia collo-cygni]|uniref:Uncharacterized protein n=1 Tax=Ramularia collo-cygni TaxID=112498 RepID=A0A2D3VM58_9PEZI|nr:uncharacterized protein RCC_10597 [Ramularia collo-cygni]CZT24869.1 uncharacterized protein RCC_10597 [Ramularia collo-cygni]